MSIEECTAREAVAMAIEAGAAQAEATFVVRGRFSAEARDRTLTKLERSTGQSLYVRIYAGGRTAALSTTQCDPPALRAALARTVAQAMHVAPDPYAGLPDPDAAPPQSGDDLELYCEAVASRDPSEKIDEALELERRVRAADRRIVNSNGSRVGDAVTTTAFANSHGFAAWYRGTTVERSSSPVARDADAKRTASYGTAARRLGDLESLETVAEQAAYRTVALFGARKPATAVVPVIFERDVASGVLADLFAAVSAANVATGNSWLAQCAGERVGSELVTVFDDGCMPGLLGSSPFDGEGVRTRRTPVFERGVLRTFLYDTYYARKLGARSTGNSSGGGIGPNTFYLERGERSLEELIAATPRGILVLDTIGFATEHASGTYSRGARGFAIEGGELAYPIDECTIASSFPQMLAGIDAVASDLRFDGSVVSPSFRVAEMTVSGS